jgi:enoyl-CoA hydratase
VGSHSPLEDLESVVKDREVPDELEVVCDGDVAVIAFNRVERLNALSYGLLCSLDGFLESLHQDTTCRVVVLTGRGKAFSSGVDLREVAERPWNEKVGEVQSAYALQEYCGRIVWKLRRIPQPVIAAVNGAAVGGGFSLALAADIRILEPEARFNAAFVTIGASGGDFGSSYFLPRIVGWERAAEILYTGRFVEAEEAIQIGLATRLVGSGESVAAAESLARELCANAPFSTRMTKSLLTLSMDGASLDQMIELENRTQILSTRTADFVEGVTAFAEKRQATYSDQ